MTPIVVPRRWRPGGYSFVVSSPRAIDDTSRGALETVAEAHVVMDAELADTRAGIGVPRARVPTAVGASVGRYVVLEELGRGGMGRVLRAYDPKLEREVALKEVRSDAVDRDLVQRLVLEARAMAKLSHPNVVAVYDVELLDEANVVLVMEYVPGRTLKQWLGAAERGWAEIVQCFVSAGRGLAAAHAAELLHRDFKPANVLVGKDGSVKVTDFGLAKGTQERSASGVGSEDLVVVGQDLTQTGIVLGTPRYMSPEQLRGEPLTPAADQYAYCVALWEALCGAAPFDGPTMELQKVHGPPSWPKAGVPRRVAEAIGRGLRPRAAERWPSMSELLAALAWDPGRRRRTWLLATVGLSSMVAVGASWQAWTSARAERCSGARARLDEVWGAARRAEVEAAMRGVGAAYVTKVWERTARELDGYADAWASMHTEACEATTIRGEQSAAVMDLRMACLRRASMELEAAVDLLADADAQVVQRAHEIVAGLRPLSRCADVEALQADVEPPAAADAATVEQARRSLEEARVAEQAGRYSQARSKVEEAKARLGSVGYEPVWTELALREAVVLEQLGEHETAEARLREALESASAWRQWEAMAEAALRLTFLVGVRHQRPDEALRYRELALGLSRGAPQLEARARSHLASIFRIQGKSELAEAEHRRALAIYERELGSEHPHIAASRNNLANALQAQGKLEDAELEHRRALALRERVLGPEHPLVASSRSNLAVVLSEQGRLDEAELETRRALELRERSLGLQHPDVAMSHNNLATVLQARGQHEQAEAEFRRALELDLATLGAEHPDTVMARSNVASILVKRGQYAEAEVELRAVLEQLEKALGPRHPKVAVARGNLGALLHDTGRPEQAEVEHRRELEALEEVLGPEHPDVARTHTSLGNDLSAQGRLEAAEVEHRRALELLEKALGAEHPDTARSRALLANVLHRRGELAAAEAEQRRALEQLEKALGAEHPDVASSCINLAEVLLARRSIDEALVYAERAWQRRQRDDVPPESRAQTAFVLAQVLWASGRDPQIRARARSLAEQALTSYAASDLAEDEPVQAVRTWLEERG